MCVSVCGVVLCVCCVIHVCVFCGVLWYVVVCRYVCMCVVVCVWLCCMYGVNCGRCVVCVLFLYTLCERSSFIQSTLHCHRYLETQVFQLQVPQRFVHV